MSDKNTHREMVVSYDCLPKIGGAHMWMYEVYRRWHSPVTFFTRIPSVTASEAAAEVAFDQRAHGSLSIVRTAAPLDDINLLDPRCLGTIYRHTSEIRRHAGDSVTLHSVRAFPEGLSALAYKWRHPRSTRLVTYAHGEELLIAQTSGQLKRVATWVLHGSDLVIVNSENTRRIVERIAPRSKIRVIHPGVDVESFRPPAQDVAKFRATWPWSRETTVLATVARMEPRKNQVAVIRAVANLRRAGHAVAYVCGGGGSGPEIERLRQLAVELGVADSVQFPGLVDDREKVLIYAACDVYVMPSIQIAEMIEGFGIVFMEAAAASKPCICGRIGGQPEAVRDGETGFVIDGENQNELDSAIARLCQDEGLRRRLGEAGRSWAEQHDWLHVAAQTRAAVDAAS